MLSFLCKKFYSLGAFGKKIFFMYVCRRNYLIINEVCSVIYPNTFETKLKFEKIVSFPYKF
jgi:hypothetical protein